jgi:hypothetical protein
MAHDSGGVVVSYTANGNLSTKQYFLVQPTTVADNSVKLATAATQKLLGVLQNTPSTGGGDGASVMINGVTKAVKDSTGAAIAKGASLTATTGGGVKTSTSAVTQYRIGVAMEAMAAGTTGLITMQITHEGRGSSAN